MEHLEELKAEEVEEEVEGDSFTFKQGMRRNNEDHVFHPIALDRYRSYIELKNKQQRIDEINRLVDGYKDGEIYLAETLLAIFRPYLLKQCNKYNQLYSGVHTWSNIEQESMTIFRDLMDEYTVGGVAYFNVFIMRKLPFRLRYFFIKEIKHRGKNLCHDEEQFLMHNLISENNEIEDLIVDEEDKDNLKIIMELIESNLLNDRERGMLKQNIFGGKSHEKIAEEQGISRSRVSKIVGVALEKIRKEMIFYFDNLGIDHSIKTKEQRVKVAKKPKKATLSKEEFYNRCRDILRLDLCISGQERLVIQMTLEGYSVAEIFQLLGIEIEEISRMKQRIYARYKKHIENQKGEV